MLSRRSVGPHMRRCNPAEVKDTTDSKCGTQPRDVQQTDNPIWTSFEQSLGPNPDTYFTSSTDTGGIAVGYYGLAAGSLHAFHYKARPFQHD